ncbi:MAG: tetratricopeptide repeat protein [Armatimonadetes bacterium]|nr:tetratricopeptide repeat protein [Armatimonadota bacterium]
MTDKVTPFTDTAAEYESLLTTGQELRHSLDPAGAVSYCERTGEFLGRVYDSELSAPKRADLLLIRAELSLTLGKWDEAARDLDEVIAFTVVRIKYEPLVHALLGRGEIEGFRGNAEAALDYIETGLALAAEHYDKEWTLVGRIRQGGLYSRLGWHQEAANLLASCHPLVDEMAQEDPDKGIRLRASLFCQEGLCAFRDGDLEKAGEFYEHSKDLFRKRSGGMPIIAEELAETHRYYGVVCSLNGEYKEALENYREALRIYKKRGNPFGIAKVYNSIGQMCIALTKLEEALHFLVKGEKICQDLGAVSEAAAIYGKMGQAYMVMEDYQEAVKFFLKDLKLSQKSTNIRALAHTNRNLGNCYGFIGEPEQAIASLEDSLRLFSQVQDELQTAGVHQDLSYVYINEGNLGQAEVHAQEAHKIFEKHDRAADDAYTRILIAVILRHRKQYNEALPLFEGEIEVLKAREPGFHLVEAYYQFGLLSLNLEDHEKALEQFRKGYTIAKSLGLHKQAERNFKMIERMDELEIVNLLLEGA